MGLDLLKKKFENLLKISWVANGYCETNEDLKLINDLCEVTNDITIPFKTSEDIYSEYTNRIKYCNYLIQLYPAVCKINPSFDKNSKEDTIRVLKEFKAILLVKDMVEKVHDYLKISTVGAYLNYKEIEKFVDDNLKPKLEKNKKTIFELLVEENKFKLLSSGVLKDKKFIKKSEKAYKIISRLVKKNKLFIKNTKVEEIELVKKYISKEEIISVVNAKSSMEYRRILIHAMGSKATEENKVAYDNRVKMFAQGVESKFKESIKIEKINNALFDFINYSSLMFVPVREVYYEFKYNYLYNDFDLPIRLREAKYIDILLNYLNEGRANNYQEALDIFEKEHFNYRLFIIVEEEFDRETKERKEFNVTLEKDKKQDYYIGALNVMNSNKDYIETEKVKYIASVDKQIERLGLFEYIAGVDKLIPYKKIYYTVDEIK